MIKEKILNSPNEFLQFADDKEARQLLFELGLIDKFSKTHPEGKASVQYATGDLLTHYVLATYCTGNPKSEDNGYVVFCVPRSQHSPAEMNQMMAVIMKIFRDKGMKLESSNALFPLSPLN